MDIDMDIDMDIYENRIRSVLTTMTKNGHHDALSIQQWEEKPKAEWPQRPGWDWNILEWWDMEGLFSNSSSQNE